MTTTINMPEKLCEKIDKRAKILGMDSSQFFIFAVEQYIKGQDITNKTGDYVFEAQQKITKKNKKVKKSGLGIFKGKIWTADDFDEPLAEIFGFGREKS